MTRQALTIEEMANLASLGIDTSDAHMVYVETPQPHDRPDIHVLRDWGFRESGETHQPAYDVANVLSHLPLSIEVTDIITDKTEYHGTNRLVMACPKSLPGRLFLMYTNDHDFDSAIAMFEVIDGDLLSAAYKLLCWAVGNGFTGNSSTGNVDDVPDNEETPSTEIDRDKAYEALKQCGFYPQWHANLISAGEDEERFIKTTKPEDWIIDAFCWQDTPENEGFWSTVNMVWEEYIEMDCDEELLTDSLKTFLSDSEER